MELSDKLKKTLEQIFPGPYLIYFNKNKVGGYGVCQENRFELRMQKQGFSLKETKIIETHTDLLEVSERERYLQRRDGYLVDTQPYWFNLIRTIKSQEPASRKKQYEAMMKNLAQNTEQWRESRRKYLTGRSNPNHSVRMKGKGNPAYGTGNTYIEVTTGFIGTASEMENRFGIYQGSIALKSKLNRPLKTGPNKGLFFKVHTTPTSK